MDFGFNDMEQFIVGSFFEAMRDTPCDKVKVKDVAERCNISRTAFYRYFEDMSDLLERVERAFLEKLSLYRTKALAGKSDEYAGKPFESMEQWFALGIELRPMLSVLMGSNGDPYFKERLAAQVRRELDVMMDDDRAPKDRLRPYYVAQLGGSYIGLLSHVVMMDDSVKLISPKEIATIANSVRVAYYRCTDGAPKLADSQLYGE